MAAAGTRRSCSSSCRLTTPGARSHPNSRNRPGPGHHPVIHRPHPPAWTNLGPSASSHPPGRQHCQKECERGPARGHLTEGLDLIHNLPSSEASGQGKQTGGNSAGPNFSVSNNMTRPLGVSAFPAPVSGVQPALCAAHGRQRCACSTSAHSATSTAEERGMALSLLGAATVAPQEPPRPRTLKPWARSPFGWLWPNTPSFPQAIAQKPRPKGESKQTDSTSVWNGAHRRKTLATEQLDMSSSPATPRWLQNQNSLHTRQHSGPISGFSPQSGLTLVPVTSVLSLSSPPPALLLRQLTLGAAQGCLRPEIFRDNNAAFPPSPYTHAHTLILTSHVTPSTAH